MNISWEGRAWGRQYHDPLDEMRVIVGMEKGMGKGGKGEAIL